MTKTCTTEELLAGTQIPLDVFSYHYYNGVSERIAGVLPARPLAQPSGPQRPIPGCGSGLRQSPCSAQGQVRPRRTDVGHGIRRRRRRRGYLGLTYLDVLRTLNELGSYATITDGVIFHNTLASSDYGFLEHGTFLPRPNYFAALLWNRLMGSAVYDCRELNRENVHVYCHSRKDGACGVVYLIINNSLTDAISVTIPQKAPALHAARPNNAFFRDAAERKGTNHFRQLRSP